MAIRSSTTLPYLALSVMLYCLTTVVMEILVAEVTGSPKGPSNGCYGVAMVTVGQWRRMPPWHELGSGGGGGGLCGKERERKWDILIWIH